MKENKKLLQVLTVQQQLQGIEALKWVVVVHLMLEEAKINQIYKVIKFCIVEHVE